MVLVPAGRFVRGSTPRQAEAAYREAKKKYRWMKKEWFDAEVPQRRIHLDAFYIDRYPVTNARLRKPGKPAKDYGSKFNGARRPMVGVTWTQARDYCKSVGKRLPTEAEREKAARGVDGRRYPWGNQWDGSKVIWDKNRPVRRTRWTGHITRTIVPVARWIWRGILGSGWRIDTGRTITPMRRIGIQKGRPLAAGALCSAVRGATTIRRSFARRIAASGFLASGTSGFRFVAAKVSE